MDGKYFDPDSNFLLGKCSRRCDGGVDRISELPDEIVLLILSFLSFLSLREAVTTSVLSSRWSDLWKHIPNLNLDAKLLTNHYKKPIRGRAWDAERCKYIEIVNSVLQSHKAPSLKEFRISFYANKSAQRAVAKWLEFVLSRQVERLKLDLLCLGSSDVVSYEELLGDNKVCLPQNHIGFKSLKSLHLKWFKVSGEAIDSFLRNCPLLEKLYIHSSILTSDIVVCETALALKHFSIHNCHGLPFGKNSIKVSAANLTWLRVRTTQKLVLSSVSAAQLQFLSLDIFFPEVCFANAFPQMPELKELAVRFRYGPGAYEDGLLPVTALIRESPRLGLLPVTALIRASPRLQEFKLQVEYPPILHSTFKNGEKHRHQHLKAFKFIGFFKDAADHLELLKYILDNCVVLEKIILGCPSLARAEPRAARYHLEQLLDVKVPDHIQLYIV